jgi:hypothetical protein
VSIRVARALSGNSEDHAARPRRPGQPAAVPRSAALGPAVAPAPREAKRSPRLASSLKTRVLLSHEPDRRKPNWIPLGKLSDDPISGSRQISRGIKRRGTHGWIIECLGCGREFDSKGLRCCSAKCERAYLDRQDAVTVMAEVGLESLTRRCQCEGCPHHIPNWRFGAGEQHGWNCKAERLCGLEVNDQLVLRRRLHRQVGWLVALEDAIDVSSGTFEFGNRIRSVRGEAPTRGVVSNFLTIRDRGDLVLSGQPSACNARLLKHSHCR